MYKKIHLLIFFMFLSLTLDGYKHHFVLITSGSWWHLNQHIYSGNMPFYTLGETICYRHQQMQFSVFDCDQYLHFTEQAEPYAQKAKITLTQELAIMLLTLTHRNNTYVHIVTYGPGVEIVALVSQLLDPTSTHFTYLNNTMTDRPTQTDFKNAHQHLHQHGYHHLNMPSREPKHYIASTHFLVFPENRYQRNYFEFTNAFTAEINTNTVHLPHYIFLVDEGDTNIPSIPCKPQSKKTITNLYYESLWQTVCCCCFRPEGLPLINGARSLLPTGDIIKKCAHQAARYLHENEELGIDQVPQMPLTPPTSPADEIETMRLHLNFLDFGKEKTGLKNNHMAPALPQQGDLLFLEEAQSSLQHPLALGIEQP